MESEIVTEVHPVTCESAIHEMSYNNNQDISPANHEDKTNKNVKVLEGKDFVSGDDGKNGVDHSPRKKKKKSKRPPSKRGLGKPTGMEEFYADAPLTPEQFAEQRQIYNPAIPFIDRITTAIQKFERTRKLSPERRNVFYKWLQYGSIDTGPNMFVGGVDQENMDKDQIAAALSQVKISDEIKAEMEKRESKSEKYAIDFEGCMKGFLSYRAHNIWIFDSKEQVNLVTTTLERFMDYLLQHDACPEYQEDILRTRDLCRDASSQLWACSQAQRWLPGDFNIACSTLFGGHYGRTYDGKTYWGPEDQDESVFVGFTAEKATQIVGFAIAGAASEEAYQSYRAIVQDDGSRTFEVVKTIEDHGFEITRIEMPSKECKELYIAQSEGFRPVGRVIGKPWCNPQAAPEDFAPAENREESLMASAIQQGEYVFFLEEESLQHISTGQKVQAKISQLNCGVWFFDQFVRVLPSFETYLINEMTLGYKEPKALDEALETGSGEDVKGEAVQILNDNNTTQIEGEAQDVPGEEKPY